MTSSKRKAFPGRAEVIFEIYFLNKMVLVHIFGGPMEKYFNLCTLGLYGACTKQPDDVIYTKFSSG
jgi:hypothetical protein